MKAKIVSLVVFLTAAHMQAAEGYQRLSSGAQTSFDTKQQRGGAPLIPLMLAQSQVVPISSNKSLKAMPQERNELIIWACGEGAVKCSCACTMKSMCLALCLCFYSPCLCLCRTNERE